MPDSSVGMAYIYRPLSRLFCWLFTVDLHLTICSWYNIWFPTLLPHGAIGLFARTSLMNAPMIFLAFLKFRRGKKRNQNWEKSTLEQYINQFTAIVPELRQVLFCTFRPRHLRIPTFVEWETSGVWCFAKEFMICFRMVPMPPYSLIPSKRGPPSVLGSGGMTTVHLRSGYL